MEAPGKSRRPSRLRLFMLLTIALVGYEYALYGHWLTSVPLLPATTLELPPDRVPIGFTRAGEVIVGRRFARLGESSGITMGPLEFRSFTDGGLIAGRLVPGDRIADTLPLTSTAIFSNDRLNSFSDLSGIGLGFSDRRGVAHETFGSPWRVPTLYCIDRDHFFSLQEGTLQCYDPITDRIKWTLSRVKSVVAIAGDSAYVMRFPDEMTPDRRESAVVLSLTDGSCNDRVFPEDAAFELTGISPDGRFVAYRLEDAFEVWSLEQRSRLWRKTTAELGTRQLMFSDDGQRLMNCTLDENGRFQRLVFRSADGERLTTGQEPSDPGASVIPSIKTSGSRYAFFNTFSSRRHESDLALWLQRMAMRVGVFMPPASLGRNATLFDTERGQAIGIIDTSPDARLLTASDGLGFALFRPASRTEPATLRLYTLPPSHNWPWWSIRAIGLPLSIVVLAMAASRYRRRRCFKEDERPMVGSREG